MTAPALVLAADVHPWLSLHEHAPHLFSLGRLRHLLRERERNGLARHLIWLGRTPLIRESELASWLDEQREEFRAP